MSVKVLLSSCVIDYDHNFVNVLMNIMKEWDDRDGELIFYPRWRKLLHLGQKDCVLKAQELNCTHILFIEDDTTAVPERALQTLLKHNKDIVGGFAYSRHFPHSPCVYRKIEGEKRDWTNKEPIKVVLINPDNGLQKVDLVSFQLMLVKMDVFEKIEEPWFFYIKERGGTDIWFADKCRDSGIDMWCDTNMIIQHAGIDGKTAGFYVQKRMLAPYSKTNWTPDCSLPAYAFIGIDVSTENREKTKERIL